MPVMAIDVAHIEVITYKGGDRLVTDVTAHRDLSHARVTLITTLNAPFPGTLKTGCGWVGF